MFSRSMSSSLLLSSAAVFLLANIVSSATDVPTTCYVIDGKNKLEAGFRCNNQTTGHSSCCAIGGICYSNGVCQQSNSGVQDYLRVGCTDPTWLRLIVMDMDSIRIIKLHRKKLRVRYQWGLLIHKGPIGREGSLIRRRKRCRPMLCMRCLRMASDEGIRVSLNIGVFIWIYYKRLRLLDAYWPLWGCL
jgi:hypothetical protein